MNAARTIGFALALLAIAHSASAHDFEFYGRVEQFTWEEFVEGERILEEDGLRYNLGTRATIEDFHYWRLGLRAEGMLGSVDYEGHTVGGNPQSSNTDYFGIQCDLFASLLPRDPTGLNAHPIIGVGGRYWIRRISKGSASDGGYDEAWLAVYGQLGVELQWAATPNTRLFARMLNRPALYNNTQYSLELEDEKNFSLKPGRTTTWELEAGIAYRDIQLSVLYETLAFGRSSSHTVPPHEVFQPESEGSILGLQLALLW
ncbi:MAG: hypothetical protein M9935_09650 [Kiritimatiellae bacterium]|nr:hypothetical protein [Kiritimatiellia bacterium]